MARKPVVYPTVKVVGGGSVAPVVRPRLRPPLRVISPEDKAIDPKERFAALFSGTAPAHKTIQ